MATPKVKLAAVNQRLANIERALTGLDQAVATAFAVLEAFLASKGVFTREEFQAFVDSLPKQEPQCAASEATPVESPASI